MNRKFAPAASAAAAFSISLLPGTAFGGEQMSSAPVGAQCGPVYVQNGPVEPALTEAVADFNESVRFNSEPSIRDLGAAFLRVHYLEGLKQNGINDVPSFDEHFMKLAKLCGFNYNDTVLLVIQYTEGEKIEHDARFGGNYMRSADPKVLDEIFAPAGSYADFENQFRSNLLDTGKPVQQDLADAVARLEQLQQEAIERASQTPTSGGSEGGEAAQSTDTPNFMDNISAKEFFKAITAGTALSSLAILAVLTRRQLRRKEEVSSTTVALNSHLADALNRLSIERLLPRSTYAPESQLGEGNLSNSALQDSATTPQYAPAPQDNMAAPTADTLFTSPVAAMLGKRLENFKTFQDIHGPAGREKTAAILARFIGDESIAALWEVQQSIVDNLFEALKLYAQLHAPANKFWTKGDDYATASDAFKTALDELSARLNIYTNKFATCEAAVNAAEERFTALTEKLGRSLGSIHALEAADWEVKNLMDTYNAHNAEIARLSELQTQKPVAASEKAGSYTTTLEEFVKECESIPLNFLQNQADYAKQPALLAELHQLQEQTVATLTSMQPDREDGYHASCTEDLLPHPESLSDMLAELEQLQKSIGGRVGEKSIAALRVVNKESARFDAIANNVRQLADEVAARQKELAHQQSQLPLDVAALAQTHLANRAEAEDWGIDIDDDTLAALKEFEGDVSALKTALHADGDKPPLLQIRDMLDTKQRKLDAAHKDAERQHAEANTLRDDIATALKSIQRQTSEYNNYLSRHTSDLGGFSSIESPGDDYDVRGKTRGDLRKQLDSQRARLDHIKSSMSAAEAEVARKEAARERERRAKELAEQQEELRKQRRAAAVTSSSLPPKKRGNSSTTRGGKF